MRRRTRNSLQRVDDWRFMGSSNYRLSVDGTDIAIIEPQMRDYAPRLRISTTRSSLLCHALPICADAGTMWCWESPRANAVVRLCDARLASTIAGLSKPASLAELHARPISRHGIHRASP